MRVRGVEFSGTRFEDFEPDERTLSSLLTSFSLTPYNEIWDCTIECDIPMPLNVDGTSEEAILHVRMVLGVPGQPPNKNQVTQITLLFKDSAYRGRGLGPEFEDELLDIQNQLPVGVFMRACINCAFSDYSPGGIPIFGGMACFRDNKVGYLQVQSKTDIFRIWNTAIEYVQETYLCREFQHRTP